MSNNKKSSNNKVFQLSMFLKYLRKFLSQKIYEKSCQNAATNLRKPRLFQLHIKKSCKFCITTAKVIHRLRASSEIPRTQS